MYNLIKAFYSNFECSVISEKTVLGSFSVTSEVDGGYF